MNKEYIEREKLIRHLDDEVEACGDACAICDPITYGTILGLKSAMSYANTLPAADVAEVKHGKWVHSGLAEHWRGKDECSECHYHTADRIDLSYFNYCPMCGAKMEKCHAE